MSDPTRPTTEGIDRALDELFGILKDMLGDLQKAGEITAAVEQLIDAKIQAATRPRIHRA